jgi:glycosyltransferase involved in cell wall biosynthesis
LAHDAPAVLIVAPQPFYEDRGTPIATRQLATTLAMLGFDVDLLAYPIGADQELEGVRIIRSLNLFGIHRVPVGFSLRKLALDIGMVGSFLRLLRKRRYVAIHAVEEMAFIAVGWRGHGCPVIYDMQSSLPDQLRSHRLFRLAPVQRVFRRFERWLVANAEAIVCSAGLKEHVRSIHPTARVTEMMYMTAVSLPDPALVRKLRAEIGLATDAQVVLYSGTFEPYQGLDLLLAAMPAVLHSHPEATFVLIGAAGRPGLGDGPQVRALMESGRLHILPRQDRRLIPSFMAMADVLVSSRAYGDNVPLKIFDYMAAGKPIVATDIKAHRALLDPDCAVLVHASGQGLADGICRVLDNPAWAASLGARARQHSGRGTDGESFGRIVASVYDSVCGVPDAVDAPGPE